MMVDCLNFVGVIGLVQIDAFSGSRHARIATRRLRTKVATLQHGGCVWQGTHVWVVSELV